ncbi:MAG: NAD(P)-dependent oxidoreductase [Promethearchaeati archaeon SRVP18_Atabeyarchaeia-1]
MREKVLLLGASGSMGFAAFKELWNRRNGNGERKYDIVLLLRPSSKNKELLRPYEKSSGIRPIHGAGITEDDKKSFRIVWGDATIYSDMLEAVRGVDWILCPMAFIAPEADHKPDMAKAVNTTAIEYVIKAIYEVGGQTHIKFIYTGSVAETGDRLQAIHLARVGDPLKPSAFDFYATTKIAGERAVIESGLKYWVSLRQTYIALPDAMSLMDPIMFHQPIDTHIELNTNHDAGRGLVNCLDVPEDSDFWRRVYNMSGGPSCRVIFLDYLDTMMRLLGMGDYRKIMDRRWFALRNFHCQYFEDSYILNNYIHNWGETLVDHYRQVKKNAPRRVKLASKLSKIPGLRRIIRRTAYKMMRRMVSGKDGTLYWFEQHNDKRIAAFYGSYATYEAIPDWDLGMPENGTQPVRLDHGYDESKEKLDVEDLQGVAEFRGGKLLANRWNGDLYEKLRWKCALGHEFDASPYLVLKTGHWCPIPPCTPPPWNYDEIAKVNPFFAQVWYKNHSKNEHNYFDENCYRDIL